MNRFAVEKVLWDLVSTPAQAAALSDMPETYLASRGLGLEERGLLARMDAKALIRLQINPMLVMRAWQMVRGRDQLARYIQELNTPD